MKLVPAAAEASVALAALFGLDWTIAPDPTDLIALSVLPLAWHVASHRGPLAPRAWAERLAVGLGVAACVASPPPRPSWNTAAYLVNRTGERLRGARAVARGARRLRRDRRALRRGAPARRLPRGHHLRARARRDPPARPRARGSP
ncbi:MAG: hypothetical protein M5U28_33720 [Sandaracinaceae bacterium]|nr:hypothetical protein [Sandaracinaceae bacterium]